MSPLSKHFVNKKVIGVLAYLSDFFLFECFELANTRKNCNCPLKLVIKFKAFMKS